MRKFAWWSIGFGLVFMLAPVGQIVLAEPLGARAGEAGRRLLPEVMTYLRFAATPIFMGGVLLLAATAIANAITKAQGMRESP